MKTERKNKKLMRIAGAALIVGALAGGRIVSQTVEDTDPAATTQSLYPSMESVTAPTQVIDQVKRDLAVAQIMNPWAYQPVRSAEDHQAIIEFQNPASFPKVLTPEQQASLEEAMNVAPVPTTEPQQ